MIAPRRGFVIVGTLLLAAAACLLVALVGLAALALAAAYYRTELPALDRVTDYRPVQHLQVYTSDGVEIAQFGSERRIFVPVGQVPKLLKDAVIAVEDADFYAHAGISWRGLARVAWAALSGGRVHGASTITQQVARTFFLSMRRTPERKIKEALLARQIEHVLTKDQILERYLNQIYLGQRSYGYAAAAQTYFGKTLAELDLAETAMLAGIQQNPVYANPAVNFERARLRQATVLRRLHEVGVISEAERQAALAQKVSVRDETRTLLHAEHVAEMARRAVVERLGEKAYTEGIRVTTSIRAEDQRAAHAALRRAVLAHERRQPWRGPEDFEALPANEAEVERAAAALLKEQRDDDDLRVAVVTAASPREISATLASGETVVIRGEGLRALGNALARDARSTLAVRRGAVIRVTALPAVPAGKTAPAGWAVAQWPEADAAFVALDPASGRVRALVGGFDFARSPFNRATSAWRQPGSALKPFLYSAALEHGLMPETLADDLPLAAADGGTPAWNPGNSDDRFDGEMTLREALVRSKNLVSIRVLQHLSVATLRDWITRFGFDADKHPDNLTLALGTGAVTPLQMAAAYAVFANGGHRVSPVVVERITDARGNVLFEAPPPPPLDEASRVLSARNAFVTSTLLADVTARGTAARAQAALQRPDLYGKTGTTDDAVDAWFAGYAPGAVAVAWVGHDEPKSLGERESGGGLALPIWIDAMARMLRGVPVRPLASVDGVVHTGSDWRYAEFADGGFVPRIGVPQAAPLSPQTAASAATQAETAASAPR